MHNATRKCYCDRGKAVTAQPATEGVDTPSVGVASDIAHSDTAPNKEPSDDAHSLSPNELSTARSPRPEQMNAQPGLLMRPLLHAPEWWQVPGEVARAARSFDSTHKALARGAEAAFQSTVRSTNSKRSSQFYRAVNRYAA